MNRFTFNTLAAARRFAAWCNQNRHLQEVRPVVVRSEPCQHGVHVFYDAQNVEFVAGVASGIEFAANA